MLILITVLLHPITHVNKIATQIAAGVRRRQGLPQSAAERLGGPFIHQFGEYPQLGITFWFWSHWAFSCCWCWRLSLTPGTVHMFGAVINDMMRPERKRGTLNAIDLERPTERSAWGGWIISPSCN